MEGERCMVGNMGGKGEWWLEAGDWLEVGWRLVGGWRLEVKVEDGE